MNDDNVKIFSYKHLDIVVCILVGGSGMALMCGLMGMGFGYPLSFGYLGFLFGIWISYKANIVKLL